MEFDDYFDFFEFLCLVCDDVVFEVGVVGVEVDFVFL